MIVIILRMLISATSPSPLMFILVLLLIQFVGNAFSQNTTLSVPVEMKRNEFHRIVKRECINELAMIPEGRDKIWKQKSKKYFKAGRSCQNPLFEDFCTMPFLVCDSVPSLSGFNRMALIRKRVLDNTPPNVQHLVEIDDIPMYNGDDKTCVALSMTPKTARKLAGEECLSDSPCVIQSFIPMMKIAYGAVDFINHSVDNKIASLSVMAELSPYYRDIREDILLNEIVELAVESGQTRNKCRQQLYDTFPSTGKSYDTCGNFFYESDVQAFWLSKSIISFSISLTNDQTSEKSKEKVFRFIASLAIRPEILSMEVSESYGYIY